MIERWQLQDAKNRFSEVVNRALHRGPQTVTRRGVDTVVVVSVDEFKTLTRKKESLVDFLLKSPLRGANLDLRRSKDLPREVDL